MTAYLDHIERSIRSVNAIVALQDRAACWPRRASATRSWRAARRWARCTAFPHAVKDLQPVKGIRFTQGSPIFKDFVPTADSLMVERLRKAGAIFIGKTNTPEFGLGSHTYNPVYGVTRNAYDQTRSAGGSSGGAAVSLALRMLPLADGSDYGGSLRNPGRLEQCVRLSHQLRPRARHDARDVWLPSMGVAGPDGAQRRRPGAAAVGPGGLRSPRAAVDGGRRRAVSGRSRRDLKGKRIAWAGDFGGYAPYEPGVLEVCGAALKTFEGLGCIVEEAHARLSARGGLAGVRPAARLAERRQPCSPTTTIRPSARC